MSVSRQRRTGDERDRTIRGREQLGLVACRAIIGGAEHGAERCAGQIGPLAGLRRLGGLHFALNHAGDNRACFGLGKCVAGSVARGRSGHRPLVGAFRHSSTDRLM
jgi:hypothetical protein